MAELSVIFVDVRGFTALSQRLPPIQLVDKLNRFYKLAARVVVNLGPVEQDGQSAGPH